MSEPVHYVIVNGTGWTMQHSQDCGFPEECTAVAAVEKRFGHTNPDAEHHGSWSVTGPDADGGFTFQSAD